jgi:two-component system sensor histidine kinase QseC
MPSIRRALSVPLLGGVLLSVALAGIASSLAVERLMRREFDRALLAKAQLLATLTEQDQGAIHIDFADEDMPEFSTAAPREFFELWTGGGRIIERSRSLAKYDLPRQSRTEITPQFLALTLPDGRSGRLVRISFVPQSDERETDPEPALLPTAGPRALLAVARGTEDFDRLVFALYMIDLIEAAVIALAMGLLIRRGVTRGLAPLGDLARQVATLGSERLAARVAVDPPVDELAPIVVRLNDLLARLEQAFARERQFSANVAHELRTPIAELKTLAEVGARWPDDPDIAGPFFDDALAIAERMEATTDQLLALSRTEAGLEIAAAERVELADLVDECWLQFAPAAERRRLGFERKMAAGFALTTDRAKLEHILTNLLANAVEYSPEGSRIELRAESHPAGFPRLEISNLAPNLTQDDLRLLFVRFWRKDAARAGADHSGLGLALVYSLAELLGFTLSAHLSAEGRLAIRFDGSAAIPPPAAGSTTP